MVDRSKLVLAILCLTVLAICPRPASAQNKCDAVKVGCANKELSCVLKVQAKAIGKGEAVDQQKLDKCADKFDGGSDPSKGCFVKLEDKQDSMKPETVCTVTGDTAAVAAALDACSDTVLALITTSVTSVAGDTVDYFSGAAIPAVGVVTDGLLPEVSTTSDVAGAYALTVPVNSEFLLSASKSSYRTTLNESLSVANTALVRDAFVVSTTDALRQYGGLGLTPTAGKGSLFADLRANDSTPITGVVLADIVLLDAANAPAPVFGPYFFGAAGDVVNNVTLSTSTAFGGRARVAFLDCSPGSYSLKVTVPPDIYTVPVECVADGVTLVTTQ